MKQGYGLSINKVALNVNRTTVNGKVAFTMKPNGSLIENAVFDFYLGDSTFDTIGYNAVELQQKRVWHLVYLPSTAESVSIFITNTPDILLDDNFPFQELTINGIIVYAEPAKYI
jgi:hypothetical protein